MEKHNIEISLTADVSEVEDAFDVICRLFEPSIFKHVPDALLNELRAALKKRPVTCFATAICAGDNVVRFGVSGRIKKIVAAARALQFDLSGGH